MTESTLSGKIALITGGGRGIGAAIAHALAKLGPTVVICGRTLPALQETAAMIRATGGQCEAMTCDITDWNSVAALAGRIEQTFGRLDVLVNNAGIGSFDSPLHLMPPATWDAIFDTNLRGVYYLMRAFVPLMLESGGSDIINISSIASKNALANGAAYAASKWGLNGLSYSVAEELRGKNIRVSVVCPGSVHTEFSPHTGKDATKMLHAEDVAHAVKMLVTQPPRAFASEVVLRPTQKP